MPPLKHWSHMVCKQSSRRHCNFESNEKSRSHEWADISMYKRDDWMHYIICHKIPKDLSLVSN